MHAMHGIAVLNTLVSYAAPTGFVVTLAIFGIVVNLRAIPVRKIWHIGRPELFNILLFIHVTFLRFCFAGAMREGWHLAMCIAIEIWDDHCL